MTGPEPRPVAYVTVDDPPARARIVETVERAGWRAIPQPTGFHLLHAIADVVDGKHARLEPALIVIDAYARGCTGTTIAAGLRDLGIAIPIVLIATPDQVPPLRADDTIRVTDAHEACDAVAALTRQRGARDSPTQRARVLTAAIRDPRFEPERRGPHERTPRRRMSGPVS